MNKFFIIVFASFALLIILCIYVLVAILWDTSIQSLKKAEKLKSWKKWAGKNYLKNYYSSIPSSVDGVPTLIKKDMSK